MSSTNPLAASFPRRVLAHAKVETRNILGNGEQLIVSLFFPALVLISLTYVPISPAFFGGTKPSISQAVAATAATAIIATSFTGQAISTGFDRRGGVLKWLATTPLGRGGYLSGKLLSLGLIHLLQLLVLGALALALGFQPAISNLLALFAYLLGAICFGALALLMAGTLRAEAVLALANIAFVILVAVGGIFIPVEALWQPLAAVVTYLPSALLATSLKAALAQSDQAYLAAPELFGLLLWALLFVFLTKRYFGWTSV